MYRFVLLPDLVVLEIMSYLTPMENLYSFFDVDDKLRCNNLLRERRYSVDIPHISMFMKSNIFRYLCANVLPHISCHTESLKISVDFVGSRIVYDLPSTIFSNISSLHLHSLQVEVLEIWAWSSTSSSLFQGVPQSLMHCWCLLTSLTTSGIYLSRILPFLPKLRVVTIYGGINQLTALATYRSSTLIQLNVLSWIDASVDILDETYFPNLQFLSINLYQQTTTGEIIRIERTIEQSFAHLPNLISLHYYSLMTNYDFTQTIKPNRYSCFFNVHIEKTRIIIWK
ncbi:unnamed protein product [Rotaria sp. Silwood2]|nr:unnamed protein product [Rotaria sp. Silwood2]CAF4505283.1 unnamed protein product [Rotaria sp. Silwood2]